MTKRWISATVVAALCGGGLIWTGAATAGTLADTTVTIKAEGTDLSGTISSPRPRRCAKDRKVVVFKQAGSEQDPSVDEKIASDTASRSGDVYRWSTGNTGMTGKFYARAARTADCKPDTSRTVRATN